ncbi:MAG: hypothetical protein GY900_12740 [Actinomycetia bacterium]|nr:hypothetical protein [Actinomycetes bacterium]
MPVAVEVDQREPDAPEGDWPENKRALESALPTSLLGDSKPLIDFWEMAYGTQWQLSGPAVIAGVSCNQELRVMENGWSCTLAEPFTFNSPSVTQKSGTTARFTYGEARPSGLTLTELEPQTARLVVEGIPCADFVQFVDGKFRRCILASDHAFGSIVIPADSDVERVSSMDTLQVCATKPVKTLGEIIPADTCFIIDGEGNVDLVEDGFGL